MGIVWEQNVPPPKSRSDPRDDTFYRADYSVLRGDINRGDAMNPPTFVVIAAKEVSPLM